MSGVDAGLAAWVRSHRYFAAAEVKHGESGIALLVLQEVDHGRPFPVGAESGTAAAVLVTFCLRLRTRVVQDDELRDG